MWNATGRRVCATAVVFILAIVCAATAKYSGGTGEPNDPYQIATVADLIALGETPADYDKHFIMTADIDLDPNLPGRKVLDKAVIAPDTNDTQDGFQGTSFTGSLDGNNHTISHMTIQGGGYVGLFGCADGVNTEIKALGLVNALVKAQEGECVGGLVGHLMSGTISACYLEGGRVRGMWCVGGLVGESSYNGHMTLCYSTADVYGGTEVGGLVGLNDGRLIQCYSTGKAHGIGWGVGGLVGYNKFGAVVHCYSTGAVSGETDVGGLIGVRTLGPATGCFWDVESSGCATSVEGTGLTTAQMQDARTYLDKGWDWVGETANGTREIWQMPKGGGYPVLAFLTGYTPPQLRGAGTAEDPYLISNAQELGAMYYGDLHAHYRLITSIDLSGTRWAMAVIPWFAGTFDGNGLTISHLTIEGGERLGLFGELVAGAEIRNLGIVDVSITTVNEYAGGLAGISNGSVTRCYSTGVIGCVTGRDGRARMSFINIGRRLGGLVGDSNGRLTQCHSIATVSGVGDVGGLVGGNAGAVSQCYSAGSVKDVGPGEWSAFGGLVGQNSGPVTRCYSASTVASWVSYGGGLVGTNVFGVITECYSVGAVTGNERAAGLVGQNGWKGEVGQCFWDVQASGQTTHPWSKGTGLTTMEMQRAKTFLDAGWDFVGETANGTDDIWCIEEGKDYPRLWWETAGDPSGTAAE